MNGRGTLKSIPYISLIEEKPFPTHNPEMNKRAGE